MKRLAFILLAAAFLTCCTAPTTDETTTADNTVYLTQEISPAAVQHLYDVATAANPIEGKTAVKITTAYKDYDNSLLQRLATPFATDENHIAEISTTIGTEAVRTLYIRVIEDCGMTASFAPLTNDSITPVSIDGEDMLRTLNENRLSLLVRNKGITTQHQNRGVQDLLQLITEQPDRLQGAVVADKIIGKAAAALMAKGGVKAVYTNIICTAARELFEAEGILVTAKEEVPQILNRDRSGQCPIDATLNEAKTVDECVEILTR